MKAEHELVEYTIANALSPWFEGAPSSIYEAAMEVIAELGKAGFCIILVGTTLPPPP